MIQHCAAGKLTPGWIGEEVGVQLPPVEGQAPRTYRGWLSDYETMKDGTTVTLFLGGRLILVHATTTVTRGNLDVPGLH